MIHLIHRQGPASYVKAFPLYYGAKFSMWGQFSIYKVGSQMDSARRGVSTHEASPKLESKLPAPFPSALVPILTGTTKLILAKSIYLQHFRTLPSLPDKRNKNTKSLFSIKYQPLKRTCFHQFHKQFSYKSLTC